MSHNDLPLSQSAWLLVASAEEAAFYVYEGPKSGLRPHHRLQHTLPPTQEMVSDRRGRNKNQQMPGGESYAEPTDPRAHEKLEFVKRVAKDLYDHHQDYDRLVMAAAPTILGLLRDELHPEVQKRLQAECDKNLSQYDENTLPDHLADVLQFENERYGFDDPRAHKYTPANEKTLNRKEEHAEPSPS